MNNKQSNAVRPLLSEESFDAIYDLLLGIDDRVEFNPTAKDYQRLSTARQELADAMDELLVVKLPNICRQRAIDGCVVECVNNFLGTMMVIGTGDSQLTEIIHLLDNYVNGPNDIC